LGCGFDLLESEIRAFAEQYQEGRVLFKGKWINVPDIDDFEIRETLNISDTYKHVNIVLPVDDIIFGDGYNLQTGAKVVTRQFIRSVPNKMIEKSAGQPVSARNVFIVHGHDVEPVEELKKMLIGFGLNPIVLHEQPSGSMTIIDKLERYSEDVKFAFVILTPDDELIPIDKTELPTVKDRGVRYVAMHEKPAFVSDRKPILRARQNVILEFGYFIGKMTRKKVCCLHKKKTELPYEMPSDMHGIVYIPFQESLEECRDMIVRELKHAGFKI